MRTPGDHVGALVDQALERVAGPVRALFREIQAAQDRLASQVEQAVADEETLR